MRSNPSGGDSTGNRLQSGRVLGGGGESGGGSSGRIIPAGLDVEYSPFRQDVVIRYSTSDPHVEWTSLLAKRVRSLEDELTGAD